MTRRVCHVELTPRERDILDALLDGCSNEAMARRFGLREQTIKNRLSVIYGKFGVSSRLELAVAVMGQKPGD